MGNTVEMAWGDIHIMSRYLQWGLKIQTLETERYFLLKDKFIVEFTSAKAPLKKWAFTYFF